MSLIAWYPLRDSLINLIQGNNLTGSGTKEDGGKYNSNMKINSKLISDLPMSQWDPLKGCTMMGWFKINIAEVAAALSSSAGSETKTPVGNLMGYNSYGGCALFWQGNSLTNCTAINIGAYIRGNDAAGGNSERTLTGFAVEDSKWTHVALVTNAKTKQMIMYVNGEKLAETSIQSIAALKEASVSKPFAINNNVVHGGSNIGRSIPMNICDMRLYNHALTALEVKDISKALRIHYTFSDGLLAQSVLQNASLTNGVQSGTNWHLSTLNGGSYSMEDGYVQVLGTGQWAGSDASLVLTYDFSSGDFTYGDTITFSVEVRGIQASHIGVLIFDPYLLVGSAPITQLLEDDWITYSVTIEVPAQEKFKDTTLRFLMCVGENGDAQFRNPHVSMGMGNYSDYLVSETYDYVVGTYSNVDISTDTAVGSYSAMLQGTKANPAFIDIQNIALPSSELTVAFWFKYSENTGDQYMKTLCALRTNGFERVWLDMNGDSLIYQDRSTEQLHIQTIGTLTLNEWYLIVLRLNHDDGSILAVNQQGRKILESVLEAESNMAQQPVQFSKISFGGDMINIRAGDGKIADIRVYSTVLSDNDILELAQTKLYMCDNDSIVTKQLNATKQEVEISSTYTLNNTGIFEPALDDNYEQLDYIYNLANYQIDSGIVPKTPFDAYIRLTTTSDALSDDGVVLGAADNVGKCIPFYIYKGNWHFTAADRTASAAPAQVYFEAESHITDSKQTLIINGQTYIYNSGPTMPNSSLWIFDGYWPALQVDRGANIKLHELIISNAGKLERHYIPVIQKSTGIVGLYDLVYKQFYSERTGRNYFTAGPTRITDSIAIYNDGKIFAKDFIEY